MTNDTPSQRPIRYTDRVNHTARGITEAAATDHYLDAHTLADAVEVHAGPLDPDELLLVCILLARVLKICMVGGRDEALAWARDRYPAAPPRD